MPAVERQLSAIETIVASYVRMEKISSLRDLLQHRQALLANLSADNPFNHLPRDDCERDIQAIKSGLDLLIQPDRD